MASAFNDIDRFLPIQESLPFIRLLNPILTPEQRLLHRLHCQHKYLSIHFKLIEIFDKVATDSMSGTKRVRPIVALRTLERLC